MIYRIKIKLQNGVLYQLRLGRLTLFEYGRENGKVFLRLPLRKKPQLDKPIFYLKINSRMYKISIPCLEFWLSVVKEMKGDFYLLCDDAILERHILRNVRFENSDIKIIHSKRGNFKKQVSNICSKRWKNAAFAHISVYLHAQQNKISEFWNIDADDTMIFASPADVASSLTKVASYARDNNLDAFSWDMHRSSFYGLYWTFGVTFTKLNKTIGSILKQAGNGAWRKIYSSCILESEGLDTNLDCFFSYLLDKGQLKLGTFNIENVYFMHWGIANFLEYFKTLQVVQGKKMYYPISECIDENMGYISCAKDVICLDCGISKQKSQQVLQDKLHAYFKRLIYLAKHFEQPSVKESYKNFLKQ
ncbi:MAG: hypothetical protein IKP23_00275 [Elusimicrobiaceae bacterium]|nr:hypothetical protein [Elusimicrobiaceae bacterium]